MLEYLWCAAGLVVLTIAADHLVVGSSRLAARFGISPVVVGIVVIGLGTSMPEFLVSGVAAARGDTGIAVGNIVGSNIVNLTLILGVATLTGAVAVHSTVVRREVPLTAAAVAAFALLAWWRLDAVAGAVLTALLGGCLFLFVRWAGRPDPSGAATAPRTGRAWAEALRTVAGLAGVLAGAQLLVVNAAGIATRFGVPQVVIGFTLVAIGTSLPELVTTVQGQRRGESELVIGNLFGSNLFNSLAGGAVIAFAGRSRPPAHAGLALAVTMVLATLLAWALLRRGLRLTRGEGVVLLAAYALTIPIVLAG